MNSEKSKASRPSTTPVFLNYWLPPFIYAAFIFYLSSLPGTAFVSPFFSADKVFHLGEYAVLGYLLARALGRYQVQKKKLFITAAFICFAYGLSDELHQFFVPDRCTSLMDVIVDGIGSSLGIGMYLKRKGLL